MAEELTREAEVADSLLVARAQAGDNAAFGELVARHAECLNFVLLRLLRNRDHAEDVLQEVFVRAWRGLPKFESRAQVSTWLHRIAINEANRALERRGRIHAAEIGAGDELDLIVDKAPTPAEQAASSELLDQLGQALDGLDPEYRVAIVLRDVEGMSTREAAATLDLGEAAFKSRLHRARMALREATEPYLASDESNRGKRGPNE